MSSALTLARPYARAAFELARGDNTLGAWATRLGFAAQVAADPRVAALLGDPRIGRENLVALFLPEGEGADSAFARFLGLLAENGRLAVLPEIGALYEALKHEAERVLKVRVRAAAPIDAFEANKLKEALKRRFGRDIELDQAIDPAILGGAVIDAGDVVIDGSVRGRLTRLEQALTH
ncbi:F0F1 ATP synthase subunit delta [Dokdonella koreensis]|uniref:ATP synthase subunit delta n=1 Tax=Dokdonella koreensis DS-123 TaxID=1300342 RepID=A0A167GJ12_9GAMM|nr:F0F1 ATP synthase subunit delta [Dokdonella koreensis]ANB16612.1 ATP synthase delta chain [Dokdonella koreensis DS-123]